MGHPSDVTPEAAAAHRLEAAAEAGAVGDETRREWSRFLRFPSKILDFLDDDDDDVYPYAEIRKTSWHETSGNIRLGGNIVIIVIIVMVLGPTQKLSASSAAAGCPQRSTLTPQVNPATLSE